MQTPFKITHKSIEAYVSICFPDLYNNLSEGSRQQNFVSLYFLDASKGERDQLN